MAIIGAIMVPHPPLILPEVGRGGEKQIESTSDAYREAARLVAELKPDTIVLSSPHSIMYSDYFHISPGSSADGSMARFRAGNLRISAEYDTEMVREIEGICQSRDFPAGTEGERDASLDHGTFVPLYFVNELYKSYKLVRIGLSGLPFSMHYELGMIIREASERLSRKVFYIGSGDLSHKLQEYGPYGFDPAGPEYDKRIMEVMGSGDFGKLFDFSEYFCEKAAECGHRSFVMMAGALDCTRVSVRMLSHEDVTGVGYGICTYRAEGLDPSRNFLAQFEDREKRAMEEQRKNEDAYVRLARASLESYVKNKKKIPLPQGLPEDMLSRRAGAFVSIHEEGRLRGCIGTISAVHENVAEEIIENAISAAVRDPRFPPITSSELPRLSISVDVLGPLEPIPSPDMLDVKRYGVVVTKGRKRGLLLPNLDGVDTVEEQLSIAKQKAGIRPDDDQVELARFEVIRHH